MSQTSRSFARPRRRAVWLVVAGLLVSAAAAGCSSGRSDLRVTPIKAQQTYRPDFSTGHVSRNTAGELDVVLTSEAKAAPTRSTDLRQVVHVRVLWRPMRGTKLDSPTATNATINWYVFGHDGQRTEMLEYSGAAFVAVSDSGNLTRLDVRNATLKPTTRQGNLHDPIGPAKLQGTIFARRSNQRVGDVLASVKSGIAAANETARTAAIEEASTHGPLEP